MISAAETNRGEGEPGHEQQRGHDHRESGDIQQVALDVVVLGALAVGEP